MFSFCKRTRIRVSGLYVWFMGLVFLLASGCRPALAHVSEQGFVLLLPTGLYIVFGVAAVVLTICLVAILPGHRAVRIFSKISLFSISRPKIETLTSLAALGFLIFLILVGINGSRDPLANPLPLFIWVLWWVGFVCLQGLVGDLWYWVNPWTGFYSLVKRLFNKPPVLKLPEWVGVWPGVFVVAAMAAFALTDIAPNDPHRLASVVGQYWLITFAGMMLFGGDVWLSRCEGVTMLLRNYARLAAFSFKERRLFVGVPGWQLAGFQTTSVSGGTFVLVVLALGTFEGLSETFWWLAKIGINPLAFPGRSAVVLPTLAGLGGAAVLLPVLFAVSVYLGLLLVGETKRFRHAFARTSLAVLPIALAYHFAHFLTSFLVDGQYALAAASDPWATGADYLGLGTFYVTTGFFNSLDTVKIIWFTQAGVVVAGHIIAVLLSHGIAVNLFGTARKGMLSQLPIALFMVGYTVLGLWLLAAPRGL